MSAQCSVVIFSNKAYNAIIQETFDKHPIETGGILLGHVIDDAWVVMEVLPPGINSIFEYAYFEYDHQFVNYLADKVASKYKLPLSLLGLWHRHPGSMDVFSQTDDGTNRKFAQINERGAISGLVNVDPDFRVTMYHLGHEEDVSRPYERPNYSVVDVEVGDDIIPEHFFELKFCNQDHIDLHPRPTSVSMRGGYQEHPLPTEKIKDVVENVTPSSVPTTKQFVGGLTGRSSDWFSQNWKYILAVSVFLMFFIFLITSRQLRHINERVDTIHKEKVVTKKDEGKESIQETESDTVKDADKKQESGHNI